MCHQCHWQVGCPAGILTYEHLPGCGVAICAVGWWRQCVARRRRDTVRCCRAPAPTAAARYVDGAYFGTSFPHFMLMTYPEVRPPLPRRQRRTLPSECLMPCGAQWETGAGKGPAGSASRWVVYVCLRVLLLFWKRDCSRMREATHLLRLRHTSTGGGDVVRVRCMRVCQPPQVLHSVAFMNARLLCSMCP